MKRVVGAVLAAVFLASSGFAQEVQITRLDEGNENEIARIRDLTKS